MRDKRWIAWMIFWFLVEVALMVWYVAGGPKTLFPVDNLAVVVSITPLARKATWPQRACFGALWVFAGWFLWQAFR